MKNSKSFPISECELIDQALKLKGTLDNLTIQESFPKTHSIEAVLIQFDQVLNDLINFHYPESFNDITAENYSEAVKIIELLKREVSEVRIFFQMAFPHDSRNWTEYGQCEFDQITQNQFKTLICLFHMKAFVEQYRQLFFNLHFPFKKLEEIERLKALLNDNTSKLVTYFELNHLTANRVELLNQLFKLISKLEEYLSKHLQKTDKETDTFFMV